MEDRNLQLILSAALGGMRKMSNEQKTVKDFFTKLTDSELQAFPRLREELNAPDHHGVYVIYSPKEKVLHVGRTIRAKGGIAQRLRGHMSASSSFTNKYLKGKGSKLRGKYKFRCVVVKNKRHRALIEAYATGHLCPAHIGLG